MCGLVFRLHWLAYLRSIIIGTVLVIAGLGGILLWLPLGLGLWTLALTVAASTYAHWSWNTLYFSTDGRLVRRRGLRGRRREMMPLFGGVALDQIPVLGESMDVGSLELSGMGSNPPIMIRHIANFSTFSQLLELGRQRQNREQAGTPVVVVIQTPIPWSFLWRADGGRSDGKTQALEIGPGSSSPGDRSWGRS
jgi:hypothetical protein